MLILSSAVESTDGGWFAFRHPLHEGPRAVPRPLLPPDALAQCADARRLFKLVATRTSAPLSSTVLSSSTQLPHTTGLATCTSTSGSRRNTATPPESLEKENRVGTPVRKISGHTPLRVSGLAKRVSAENSPGLQRGGLGTPGSLRKRAVKRVSSGLALRPPLFCSPNEGLAHGAGAGGNTITHGPSPTASTKAVGDLNEEEEDDIARLLAAHNSRV